MTTYRAECKLHPEFDADVRVEYADAVADLAAHLDSSHAVGVVQIEEPSHGEDGQTDPSTVGS